MKTMIAIFLLSASPTVFAHETYFEEIGNLFNNGTKPDLEQLKDKFYVGNCFTEKNPDTAIQSCVPIISEEKELGSLGKNRFRGTLFTASREEVSCSRYFKAKYLSRIKLSEDSVSVLIDGHMKMRTLAESFVIDLEFSDHTNTLTDYVEAFLKLPGDNSKFPVKEDMLVQLIDGLTFKKGRFTLSYETDFGKTRMPYIYNEVQKKFVKVNSTEIKKIKMRCHFDSPGIEK
jgi:hypothetical protein